MMMEQAAATWDRCLEAIQAKLPERTFKTWFLPIRPLKLVGSTLTIQVPSQYFFEYIEEHFVNVLRLAIDQELGPQGALEYSIIVDRGNADNQPVAVNVKADSQNAKNGRDQDSASLKAIAERSNSPQLNPFYSFDTFIEGDCNRLARTAALAVSEKPGGSSFNPLVFFGGVGLGKTHLAQAIGNRVLRADPDQFVLYVSSEKFINQVMDAFRDNSVQELKNFYLQVDTLIIDDIQYFGGKGKMQDIFFHIFNHLQQNGKQIVMTIDRPPLELEGIEDRLLSRFKWGLTADLRKPDLDTRMAIIRRKMLKDGVDLPMNVVEYLAMSVETNIRELEGVMVSLLAHASLMRREIDLELAKEVLQNIVTNIQSEVGIDYIQKMVCDYFRIPLTDIKAKSRKKEIVSARQAAMYFSRQFTSHSFKSIGQYFGGRDHATVIHAVNTVNDLMDTDAKYRKAIEELDIRLKAKLA